MASTLLRRLALVCALTLLVGGAARAQCACSNLWSNPATWPGGQVPGEGAIVTIPVGAATVYDLTTGPTYAEVHVLGTLRFSQAQSTQLDAGLIVVHPSGVLEIGSAASPLAPSVQATIRLADLGQADPAAPGLIVEGGRLELHGAPRARTWAKLAADAVAGGITARLVTAVSDWRIGEQVVLTGTSIPMGGTCIGQVRNFNLTCADPSSLGAEQAALTGVSGTDLIFSVPLTKTHLGTPPRQGEAALLSRNIVITSREPAGRRGHVKIHMGGVARVTYTEFADLGRNGIGTYPLHFHVLGNAGSQSYVLGASIHHSENLGLRVHGTNFLSVRDSVVYHVVGHGFSTEDGTEQWNTFEGNLSSRTVFVPDLSTPYSGFPTQPLNKNPNDPSDLNEGSGFWISNGRNRLRNNIATDTIGWGIDWDPPAKNTIRLNPDGSPGPTVSVRSIEVLEDFGNEAHGNWLGGFEATNFTATAESRFVNLHTWRGVKWTVYPVHSANLTFVGLFDHDPGYTEAYLAGQKNTSFVSSSLQNLLFNARHSGWARVENSTVGSELHVGAGPADEAPTVLVLGDPGTRHIGFYTGGGPAAPSYTNQHEIFLWDWDGPGQHVKLIPKGTVAADNLAYVDSARFTDKYGVSLAKEASFTGTQAPPLRLPIRIDAGRAGSALDLLDAQGLRWSREHAYTSGPPGYGVPRFGYVGGTARLGNGTLAGSLRDGASFQYAFDIPDGVYRVTLTFMETYFGVTAPGGVGSRVFDVTANGVPLFTQVDVYAAVGGMTPLALTADVSVIGGKLTLGFVRRVSYAMISALQVEAM